MRAKIFPKAQSFIISALSEPTATEAFATEQASLALTPTPTPNRPFVVAGANVEIRSGPGKIYSRIALLEKGQSAEIIGASADRQWWLVKVPYVAEGRGWVPGGLVTAKNTGNVLSVTLGKLTATRNLNVRKGPGLNYDKIGMLEQGQEVDLIGVTNDRYWWAIEINGNIGWVAADYVVASATEYTPVILQDVAQQPQSTGAPSPANQPTLTANAPVNIRSGPGKEYQIIGGLLKGQTAIIVGVSEDQSWWKIIIPGTENDQGWVAGDYVKVQNTSGVPVAK